MTDQPEAGLPDQRRVERAVEALLKDKPPGRDHALTDEQRQLIDTASELHAARPGADLPRPEFVRSLERQLRRRLPATAPGPRVSRRHLLYGAGVAAAAAGVGVTADRLLSPTRPQPAPTPEADDPRFAVQSELVPDNGTWVAVANSTVLATNAVHAFQSGAVSGFLVVQGGTVQALSAICTHMGCLLRHNDAAQRFDCPCHGASFDLAGKPLSTTYLSALPRLRSRVANGRIEVLVAKA